MADEITTPPEGEQPSRPEWLLDNFETPDAQAQAYAEARREMLRAQSDVAQLRQDMERQSTQFAEILADVSQPAVQQFTPQTDPTVMAYQRALEEGDAASALAIQLQVQDARLAQVLDQRFAALEEKLTPAQYASQEATLQLAEQQVASEFGDRWPEVAAQINDSVRDRIGSIQAPSVSAYAAAIRESAKLAEYDRLTQAETQAQADRAAKLNAQTLTGSTARVPTDTDAKKAEWAEVANADINSWSKVVGGG